MRAFVLGSLATACSGEVANSGRGSSGNESSGDNGSAGSNDPIDGAGGNGAPGADPNVPADPAPDFPSCAVRIRPLSAPALSNLPAGPGRTLTVRGEAFGTAVPPSPVWSWLVVSNGLAVPITPDAVDPAVATFSITQPGTFAIIAAASGCTGMVDAGAVPPETRSTFYWVRVVPPRESGLLPHEETMVLNAGTPAHAMVQLSRGIAIAIDPSRPNQIDLASAVPSYLRLSSSESTFWQEGRTSAAGGAFSVFLHPLIAYDLLLVPDNGWAPRLFRNIHAGQKTGTGPAGANTLPFSLDSGVEIAGTLAAGGQPIAGARVLFRAGALPSTLGLTATDGRYRLFASGGDKGRTFGAEIIAPASSHLPNLVLPESRGILIPAVASTALAAAIDWNDIAPANLIFWITGPDGTTPAPGTTVRIELADKMSQAGRLSVNGGPAIALDGSFTADAKADPHGRVTVENLPRARVRVRMIPPTATGAAQTTRVFDLSGGDVDAGIVALARKIKVTGRLTDAGAAGATVSALPEGAIGETPASAIADADGGFVLALDPERDYRLRAAPSIATGPRLLPLGNLATGSVDLVLPPRKLAPGLALSGMVGSDGRPVPGTVVEVYCLDDIPDCVDFMNPSVATAALMGEILVDDQGRFTVPLPDPGGE